MFIGQESIIEQAIMVMKGERWCIMLRGHYGYGKTSLATALASNTGDYSYQIPVGGNVSLRRKDIINIIDECHLIRKIERYYDVFSSGRFLFCTNVTATLPEAFLSRCFSFTMRDYTLKELTLIVLSNLPTFDPEAAIEIAKRCKGIPRIAVNLARKMLMLKATTKNQVIKTLERIGIDENGYDTFDRKYLEALKSGPKSKRTLSVILGVPEDEIERIEAVFIRDGKIKITSSGRVLDGRNSTHN